MIPSLNPRSIAGMDRVLYHDEKIKGAGAGKSTCETSHVPPRSVSMVEKSLLLTLSNLV